MAWRVLDFPNAQKKKSCKPPSDVMKPGIGRKASSEYGTFSSMIDVKFFGSVEGYNVMVLSFRKYSDSG